MPQANGHGPSSAQIVAVEDEEEDLNVDDDYIPGPPPTHQRNGSVLGSSGGGGGGVSRSRGSMIISRVLNLSSGKRSSATSNTTGGPTTGDTLQLSKSDHHEYVAGSGILASREDLSLAPEACTCFVLYDG